MLVSHDCLPRYICSPFRTLSHKKYNEKIPKVFPTSYLAGPHLEHIWVSTIGKLAKWCFSSMWVIYIGRASSMYKGCRKKDRWHAISFVRFNEACLMSALVLLSEYIWGCTNLFVVLCFYIVLFCSEDAPLFPFLFCLFFSFCVGRWGGIISCFFLLSWDIPHFWHCFVLVCFGMFWVCTTWSFSLFQLLLVFAHSKKEEG